MRETRLSTHSHVVGLVPHFRGDDEIEGAILVFLSGAVDASHPKQKRRLISEAAFEGVIGVLT
jgi:hypothetical protein